MGFSPKTKAKGKSIMSKRIRVRVRVKDPLEGYKKEKLQMLDDFTIFITDEIERKINSFTREIDIDHYCHDLIKQRLGTL